MVGGSSERRGGGGGLHEAGNTTNALRETGGMSKRGLDVRRVKEFTNGVRQVVLGRKGLSCDGKGQEQACRLQRRQLQRGRRGRPEERERERDCPSVTRYSARIGSAGAISHRLTAWRTRPVACSLAVLGQASTSVQLEKWNPVDRHAGHSKSL